MTASLTLELHQFASSEVTTPYMKKKLIQVLDLKLLYLICYLGI